MVIPAILYHSTIRKFLPSIKEKGLITNSLIKMYAWSTEGIYLSDRAGESVSFVRCCEVNLTMVNSFKFNTCTITDMDMEDIITFKVESMKLDPLSMVEDPHCGGYYRYRETIPFKDLELIVVEDKDG